jgi:tetratricopeptide (TPR) repeat protein
MPIDPISIATELIAGEGLEFVKDKAKRQEGVLRVLTKLGFKLDSPPANDFDGVYAYTLVLFAIDKPKPVVDFFRDSIIKNAFHKSFSTRNLNILDEETENYLEWSDIGKQLSKMDYDPRGQFAEFMESFITYAKLTRSVPEELRDQAIEKIGDVVQELPSLEDLHTELSPLDQKLDQILEIVAEQGKRKKVVPFILPQLDISNFTGRDTELGRLEEQIFGKDGSRIVGIAGVTGTGGMGKSALAFHFAYKHKDKFPDGIIGLRIDSGSVDAVAQRFASYVGIKPESLKDFSAAEIMQSVFQPLRALLIFDNAEEATAKALRPGGDLCAVIVTTRNKGLLRSLDIPETAHLDLERFDYEDTKELLGLLIGEKRVKAEENAIKQIHELVGGLPLALRIVGGTLTDQPFTPIADYAADLQKEKLDLLKDSDDKDLDVRASFSLSLKFLSESQIDLFACLGVCAPEGFSLQTIQVVSEQSQKDVRDGLARLVRLSLLIEGGSAERFVLHPLLFALAEELVDKRHLLESAIELHTKYFLEFAARHSGLQIEALDAIERELPSLILTANRLLENGITDHKYYLSLEPFFQARGFWTQALELIDAYLTLSRELNDWRAVVQLLIQKGQFLQIIGSFSDSKNVLLDAQKEADRIQDEWQQNHLKSLVLNSLGGTLQRQGAFDEAIKIFQDSLDLLVNLRDEHGQAKVLNSLGGVFQRQGKFDKAIDAFQRSSELLIEVDDRHGRAMVLNSLGGVLQRQGKLDEAANAFQKSYVLLVELGDQRGQAMVLNSLSGVLQRQGNFNEAAKTLQKGADIEEKLGNERGQAMILNSLGGVLQRQGNFDKAVDALRKSAKIEEKIGNRHGQAKVWNSLGGVFQRQGKFDQAVDAFQDSYNLLTKLGDESGQAKVLTSLGGVLQRQGKFDEAIESLEKSAVIEEKLGNEVGQAKVLNSLGGVLQRQGKFDEAVDKFKQAQEISERLNNKVTLAMVLNSLGGVLQRQGKFDEAVTAFQKSYELLVKLEDDRGQAMVLNSLGGVLQRQGKFDEAVTAFQKSYDISERLDDDRSLAMVLNSLGGVLQRQGKFDEAVDKFKQAQEISERLNNEVTLAMVLNSLGGVLQRQGKFDEAVTAFQKSYELLVKLEDDRGQAMVLNSLGGVLQRQGKFDEAVTAFQKSYDISERLDDDRSLAMVLNSLGGVLQRQGKFDEAVDKFKQAQEISERLNNEVTLAMVLNSLGGVLQRQGKFEEAVTAFQKSYELLVKLEDNRGQAMVLNSLGGVLSKQRKYTESENAFKSSIAIGKRLKDKSHLSKVHTAFGKSLLTQPFI